MKPKMVTSITRIFQSRYLILIPGTSCVRSPTLKLIVKKTMRLKDVSVDKCAAAYVRIPRNRTFIITLKIPNFILILHRYFVIFFSRRQLSVVRLRPHVPLLRLRHPPLEGPARRLLSSLSAGDQRCHQDLQVVNLPQLVHVQKYQRKTLQNELSSIV